MKKDEDSKLRQVLDSWRVSPPPAPDFKTDVWRRIALEEERVAIGFWGQLRQWLCVQLPRPAYASAALVAAILLGAATASLRASHMRERYRVDSARQYLASIDPIEMAETNPSPMR